MRLLRRRTGRAADVIVECWLLVKIESGECVCDSGGTQPALKSRSYLFLIM